MIIDGVFASEAIDSSGEILDIEGCDISTLDKDGVLNYEHKEGDKKGIGNNGEEIVGKIIYAHKIFKESDCETDRQREYWNKIGKLPFIYGMCRLYDGAGHSGAQALAAQIRDHHANNDPILVRFSIEGLTLVKKGNRLVESAARRVAATLKPCNRTAVSGLIEDPRAPEGFDKKPVTQEKEVKDILAGVMDDKRDETKKREMEHPGYRKLGGVHEVEIKPLIKDEADLKQALALIAKLKMVKALSAGMPTSAPSELTGGAALQREDFKGRALAALRDYGKKKFDKGEFKAFVKAKMPDADDHFIDHFADIAEDYHCKLKKAEERAVSLAKKEEAKAQKTPKAKAPKKEAAAPTASAPASVPVKAAKVAESQPPLTIQGKPAKIPNVEGPVFDEKTGVLHTPRGSFPMYIPSRDKTPGAKESFHNLMNDPKINSFHNYAMENWAKMNHLLKQGKLPPEVVMHATLFSQLSPNTPVPMQELMYGHLVDTMRHKGIDARDPQFATLRDDWLGRDQPDKLPDASREHYEKLGGQIRIKTKGAKRPIGSVASFMLAHNKFDNMQKYYKLHDSLVDLVNRHKDDARAGVNELMKHKQLAENHANVRKRHLAQGKPDPGEYTAGPAVAGLAPKTARYTYGMMGGGNVVVPDTHFVRYLFGLNKDTEGGEDGSIEYLKSHLWNPNNSHVLEGIDRYYAKHHDAVQHMVNHPQFAHHFEGDPEKAIFPAFWKNWVAIAPHERARGFGDKGAYNEVTDHRPFWEATDPFVSMKKSEGDDMEMTIPMRTASIHRKWANDYGDGPAMMMYFHHLVPRLLAESARRERKSLVRKMQAWTIDLRKAAADVREQREGTGTMHQESVHFAGHHVVPGRAQTANGDLALLHEDPQGYIAVPAENEKFWHPEHLVRLPRELEGTHYTVSARPSMLIAEMEQ
jgi:hypothetical protein